MAVRGALALLVLLCGAVAPRAERYALLAGNSRGGKEFEALRYVKKDLDAFQQVLTSLCGFDTRNIILLYNRTPAELAAAIDRVSSGMRRGGDDLFLFYYTGHGDDRALYLQQEEFSLGELRRKFDVMPARIRIAVLDACQSGGFTRAKGGRLAEPFLFREDSKVEGQVVLYSSSSTENSQESDLYQGSIFTFHFLNALRGCGDLSSDGKITLAEAYQYSYNQTITSTVRSSGGVQHPGYNFRIQGEGDIVLADLNLHAQGVLLTEQIACSVTIIDKAGSIVADFSKDRGSRFVVALNPGEYQVVNAAGDRRAGANVAIAKNQIAPIGPGDFDRMDI